jgi:phage replication O-like protein O
MANPQAENGHTDIANELLEVLARTYLYPNEWKIVMWVFRCTYGWHKKEDTISMTQFERHTNMSRPGVNRSLKSLVLHKILVVVSTTKLGNSYKFNKNYEEWTSTVERTSTMDVRFTSTAKLKFASTVDSTHKRNVTTKEIITKEREIANAKIQKEERKTQPATAQDFKEAEELSKQLLEAAQR